MRCDVNISVRPRAPKVSACARNQNMSSFTEIRDVIEFEKVRHMDAILRHTEVLIRRPGAGTPSSAAPSHAQQETAADTATSPTPT